MANNTSVHYPAIPHPVQKDAQLRELLLALKQRMEKHSTTLDSMQSTIDSLQASLSVLQAKVG